MTRRERKCDGVWVISNNERQTVWKCLGTMLALVALVKDMESTTTACVYIRIALQVLTFSITCNRTKESDSTPSLLRADANCLVRSLHMMISLAIRKTSRFVFTHRRKTTAYKLNEDHRVVLRFVLRRLNDTRVQC